MGFQYTIPAEDIKTYRGIVNLISQNLEEAVFAVTPEGVKHSGMDPSHVTLIDILIPAESFNIFVLDDDESVYTSVNVDNLNKILKRFSTKQDITVSTDHKNTLLQFEQGSKRFSIRYYDGNRDPPKMPKIESDIEFQIAPERFESALSDVAISDAYVKISVADGIDLSFSSNGDATSAKVDVEPEGISGSGSCLYSLDYLLPAAKSLKALADKGAALIIEFAEKKPIKVEHVINDTGHIRVLLAPRVEQ